MAEKKEEGRMAKAIIRAYPMGVFGMGCALAWYYCTFYSCVLVWPDWTVRESEHYWALALLATAIVSLVAFILLRRGKAVDFSHPLFVSIAMIAGACAPLLIFAGYSANLGLGAIYFGAVLAGVAFFVFCAQWLGALDNQNEAVREFSIPAAFLVALVLYLPIVAMKNIFSIALVALLPAVATLLFAASAGMTGDRAAAPLTTSELSDDFKKTHGIGRDFLSNAKELWKTSLLFTVLWFSFAFFRSCASPTYFTDRFDHYLLPFVCAGALAAALCVIVLFRARRVSLFTTYRWVIPFMCLGYAMLIVDNNTLSHLAFTASFVGLVGMQLCFAIVVSKQAKQSGIPLGHFLFPLLASIGIGVAAGSMSGLAVLNLMLQGITVNYAPVMIVVLVGAVMAWGVDVVPLIRQPERSLVRSEERGNVLHLNVPSAKIIDSVAETQARRLTIQFDISPREREILAYLLAGRSRPFIRDALVLSLNTVNTHVRNIYAKVGVHSQQELLTLARDLDSQDFQADAVPLRKTS